MCGIFFGRSKRFRAEDHLPVPLASAIQTFLCGGSRLPFGSRTFQGRHSLRLPLSFRLALVAMFFWHCGITPGLQVSWHEFVCMARSVLVSSGRKLGQRYVGGSVARVFIFLSVFRVLSYVCCDVVAISVLFALFRWCWPSLEGRFYGLGKDISS